MCVCMCARARVCDMRGIQYYVNLIFLRFYVYLFVDLVKRGVLTFIGQIRQYRNDYYYYYYY